MDLESPLNRQLKLCVPTAALKGDSYRLKGGDGAVAALAGR